jgi:hypothetical protein
MRRQISAETCSFPVFAPTAQPCATTEKRSYTTPKHPGITGKGFVKGDPRINRKGRPRNFDAVREVFQSVAHEEIKDKNGNALLVIEAIARSWATSKEPMLQKAFVEYCFGKVSDKHEHEGDLFAPIVILRHAHEEFEPSRS